jgi:hypothetical protein
MVGTGLWRVPGDNAVGRGQSSNLADPQQFDGPTVNVFFGRIDQQRSDPGTPASVHPRGDIPDFSGDPWTY